MKIIYLVKTAIPVKYCGYTIRTHSLLKYLSQKLDIQVYTLEGKTQKIDNVQYNLLEGSNYIEYIKNLKDKASKANLIQACSNWKVGFIGLVTARKLNIPFYYEVRGFWELSRKASYPDYQIDESKEIDLMKQADCLITLNRFMKKRLEGFGLSNIILLPNSFDLDMYQDFKEPGTQVGYIGSACAYENLDFLISEIKDLILITNQEFKRPGVKIITGISHDKIKEYYNMIDILVIPRTNDLVCCLVSPLKLVEFMGMGKVVVVSDLDPLKELVKHNETGIVYQDLRSEIDRLIGDRELRSRLARNAQKFVLDNYVWEKTCSAQIRQIRQIR